MYAYLRCLMQVCIILFLKPACKNFKALPVSRQCPDIFFISQTFSLITKGNNDLPIVFCG